MVGWITALKQSKRAAETNRNAESKIEASLKEKGVLVSSPEDIEELSLRGYGVSENEGLMLTFYEALFLLGKGIITVKKEKTGGKVNFQTLLQRFQSIDEDAWVRYLVYRDLRSRGYVAREGFGLGIDFRVYERGEYGKETAKYMIFGIQEGQPVSVEELARSLRYVQSLKKRLVLAVINRRGEVVYYSLSQLTLK
ncbi:tRNA-intron lyase [Candidatus Bathyarchaeota archaeon]|nr:MAG: tRNA-intron lyase [Candidatus Bathyarchaeota archaeon]